MPLVQVIKLNSPEVMEDSRKGCQDRILTRVPGPDGIPLSFNSTITQVVKMTKINGNK